MPGKKKNTKEAAKPEDTLENPAGAATETTAPAIDWPESTEERQLSVRLTPEEVNAEAQRMVEAMDRADQLAADKKTSAKSYDTRIEGVEKEITELKSIISTKQVRRDIHCRWRFETNGVDADGKPITHTGLKTLFREDTGEVVEILPITQEDRQMVLPLDDAEALKLNLEKLKEMGWEVTETPEDIDHGKPFQGVDADGGRTIPITADSLAGAAQALLNCLALETAAEVETAAAA